MKYTLPKGFLANGICCGVKKKRKDLAVLYSETACRTAALFTKNSVKAAPVILARKQLRKNSDIRAVVVNSGNANCMTGARGLADAKKMAEKAAAVLNVPKDTVVVSSTGIIGQFMRMEPILDGMSGLVAGLSRDGINDAADGIMTTDRFRKISSRTFDIGGVPVTLTGIAKGAGMIDPNMATMLCYLLTDANMSRDAVRKALKDSSDVSFNAITVDGDMSTNDTVMLMANGMAENRLIKENGAGFGIFRKNLDEVTEELARMVVLDGEGATKLMEVKVKGARTSAEAKKAAKAIAGSLLVKCAVLGGDPNWGRVASSAGGSGVKFDPEKMDITLDGVAFLRNGKARGKVDRKTTSVFKGHDVKIEVDLHNGRSEARVFSCDISKKYIALNSYYTT